MKNSFYWFCFLSRNFYFGSILFSLLTADGFAQEYASVEGSYRSTIRGSYKLTVLYSGQSSNYTLDVFNSDVEVIQNGGNVSWNFHYSDGQKLFRSGLLDKNDLVLNEGLVLLMNESETLVVSSNKITSGIGVVTEGKITIQIKGTALVTSDGVDYSFEFSITETLEGEAHPYVFPPEITESPVGGRFMVGSAATLSVTATGDDLKYQWMHNDKEIPNATASTYKMSNLSKANEGSYYVVVSNDGGSVPSESAELSILSIPESIALGLDTTHTAWEGNGGVAYAIDNGVLNPAHDGEDMVKTTGAISNVVLNTIVQGPGTVSFWWKLEISGRRVIFGDAKMAFFIDGNLQGNELLVDRDWEQKSFEIGEGNHLLTWAMAGMGATRLGEAIAYLDELVLPGDGRIETWAGYLVRSDRYIDTGSWLGWLKRPRIDDNWFYAYSLNNWMYFPHSGGSEGGWAYLPRGNLPATVSGPGTWGGFTVTTGGFVDTGSWFGWLALSSGSNWAYSYSLEEWVYASDPQGAAGMWVYIER